MKKFYMWVLYILMLSFFTSFAFTRYIAFKYADKSVDIKPLSQTSDNSRKPDIPAIIKSNPMKLGILEESPKNNGNGNSYNFQQQPENTENIVLIGLAQNPPKIIALVKVDGKTLILNNINGQNGYIVKRILDNKLIIAKNNLEIALDINSISRNFFLKESPYQENIRSAPPSDELNVKISRNEVEKNLKDINSLIKTVFISPYYEKQAFVGYRLSRISSNSILKKIGLKNGDIIVEINNESLENPQKMLELLSKISDVTAVKIDLVRKLKKESLFIEIN